VSSYRYIYTYTFKNNIYKGNLIVWAWIAKKMGLNGKQFRPPPKVGLNDWGLNYWAWTSYIPDDQIDCLFTIF
jgi:hypothetical protein